MNLYKRVTVLRLLRFDTFICGHRLATIQIKYRWELIQINPSDRSFNENKMGKTQLGLEHVIMHSFSVKLRKYKYK